MNYAIQKAKQGWIVWNISHGVKVGTMAKRSEAWNCARLLAGWRGHVSILPATTV